MKVCVGHTQRVHIVCVKNIRIFLYRRICDTSSHPTRQEREDAAAGAAAAGMAAPPLKALTPEEVADYEEAFKNFDKVRRFTC
jgi:hypothetical protein